MKSPQPRESDVLKACTDLLSAKRIWWERRNTGAMVGTYKGKSRFTRFGKPGVADIMATPRFKAAEFKNCSEWRPRVLWIECKAPGKKQSAAQAEFEMDVRSEGHYYLLVSDVSQLEAWLKENLL